MSEWIESKYRLPPKTGTYLIYAPSADPNSPLIVSCWWEDGTEFPKGWGLVEVWRDAVTHWMPLPPPPVAGRGG